MVRYQIDFTRLTKKDLQSLLTGYHFDEAAWKHLTDLQLDSYLNTPLFEPTFGADQQWYQLRFLKAAAELERRRRQVEKKKQAMAPFLQPSPFIYTGSGQPFTGGQPITGQYAPPPPNQPPPLRSAPPPLPPSGGPPSWTRPNYTLSRKQVPGLTHQYVVHRHINGKDRYTLEFNFHNQFFPSFERSFYREDLALKVADWYFNKYSATPYPATASDTAPDLAADLAKLPNPPYAKGQPYFRVGDWVISNQGDSPEVYIIDKILGEQNGIFYYQLRNKSNQLMDGGVSEYALHLPRKYYESDHPNSGEPIPDYPELPICHVCWQQNNSMYSAVRLADHLAQQHNMSVADYQRMFPLSQYPDAAVHAIGLLEQVRKRGPKRNPARRRGTLLINPAMKNGAYLKLW